MAITNKLIVNYQFDIIDRDFDFYEITTAEQYIQYGAYILDKPNYELKAESVAFDDHKTLYVMFRKATISKLNFVKAVGDKNLTIKQISSSNIKGYILFRLFLFSLNNYGNHELTFNNITGKLYICKPNWMAKNKKVFKALEIKVDSEMNIAASAANFSLLSNFKNTKKLAQLPRYIFSNKNCALKRITTDDKGQEVYIKRASFNKKANISFFEFSPTTLRDNKVYHIYNILDCLRKKYEKYLSFRFDEIALTKSIGHPKDVHFMRKALDKFKGYKLNFINFVKEPEYSDDFSELVSCIVKDKIAEYTVSSHILSDSCNIVLIHNKEYYQENEYPDPYRTFDRSEIIQCLSVEDSAYKVIEKNNSIVDTIIKETVIKHDILKLKHISLDDWQDFNFRTDWIFGKCDEDKAFFLIVHPNGEFDFVIKKNNFDTCGNPDLDNFANILFDDAKKEKYIVSNGMDVCTITRTNRYILPSNELFALEQISRNKQSRQIYFSGVVDINLFEPNKDDFYYNVGIKGSGMNTRIPNAPLLYKVDVVSGKNVIEDILGTMSVTFVRYKYFTTIPYPFKYLNEFILMNREHETTQES